MSADPAPRLVEIRLSTHEITLFKWLILRLHERRATLKTDAEKAENSTAILALFDIVHRAEN